LASGRGQKGSAWNVGASAPRAARCADTGVSASAKPSASAIELGKKRYMQSTCVSSARAVYSGLVGSLLNRKILAVLVLLLLAPAVRAHDIPADVTVQTFIKPEGKTLTLVVRVPLTAMRDVNFPLTEPGLLDLSRADPFLRDAAFLWIAGNIELQEENVRIDPPRLIATRVSLPSDRSFVSYADAVRHATSPHLAPRTEIVWDQAMLDAVFEYSIASDQSKFSIRPSFARLALRVVTVLRFVLSTGDVRAFEFTGDPGLIHLDPRWHQSASHFVRLGFEHILTGTDHLLFLFCLVIPIRRIKPLVIVITAFTVAHSITLIAAALNADPIGLWFPPFIETLIALSIVYMALENIVLSAKSSDGSSPAGKIPKWTMAFAFGLVHGFGFSFALRQSLQFAGSHLLTSLLSFNIGVELGQLAMLAVMVPALYALFRFVVAERVGTIILSAFIAHTAWHWTGARWNTLRQFAWPTLDVATMVMAIRGLMILVTIAAAVWIVATMLSRRHTDVHVDELAQSEREV
jgi:HupE / UreJ protein